MKRYRKLPVVIEAMQLPVLADDHDDIWGTILVWSGARDGRRRTDQGIVPVLFIDTLEGTMWVGEGDWIVKGVANEFYPVADRIFRSTYEEVTE